MSSTLSERSCSRTIPWNHPSIQLWRQKRSGNNHLMECHFDTFGNSLGPSTPSISPLSIRTLTSPPLLPVKQSLITSCPIITPSLSGSVSSSVLSPSPLLSAAWDLASSHFAIPSVATPQGDILLSPPDRNMYNLGASGKSSDSVIWPQDAVSATKGPLSYWPSTNMAEAVAYHARLLWPMMYQAPNPYETLPPFVYQNLLQLQNDAWLSQMKMYAALSADNECKSPNSSWHKPNDSYDTDKDTDTTCGDSFSSDSDKKASPVLKSQFNSERPLCEINEELVQFIKKEKTEENSVYDEEQVKVDSLAKNIHKQPASILEKIITQQNTYSGGSKPAGDLNRNYKHNGSVFRPETATDSPINDWEKNIRSSMLDFQKKYREKYNSTSITTEEIKPIVMDEDGCPKDKQPNHENVEQPFPWKKRRLSDYWSQLNKDSKLNKDGEVKEESMDNMSKIQTTKPESFVDRYISFRKSLTDLKSDAKDSQVQTQKCNDSLSLSTHPSSLISRSVSPHIVHPFENLISQLRQDKTTNRINGLCSDETFESEPSLKPAKENDDLYHSETVVKENGVENKEYRHNRLKGRKKKNISKQKDDKVEACDNDKKETIHNNNGKKTLKECVITEDDLVDGLRVLMIIEGHFYPGRVSTISPPDIYGVHLERVRGHQPHIFTREEMLSKAILDKCPDSIDGLSEGTRVCAFWSEKYHFLYPGTIDDVCTDMEAGYVTVDLDDGDFREVHWKNIRYLPKNYPLVAYEPDPVSLAFCRRRRLTSNESLESSTTGLTKNETKKRKCKLKIKLVPSRPPNEDVQMVVASSKENHDYELSRSTKSLVGGRGSEMAAFLPEAQLWHWADKGGCHNRRSRKIFHKKLSRKNELMSQGDCAVFLSTGRPDRPYIGRLTKMWQNLGGAMRVQVRWFYHANETKVNNLQCQEFINSLSFSGALFESDHYDENDIQTIAHRCHVLPFSEFRKQILKIPELRQKNQSVYENNDFYYLAGTHSPIRSTVTFEKDVLNDIQNDE